MDAFHMSAHSHAVGTRLVGTSTGTGTARVSAAIEEALERARPVDCPSRHTAVFVCETPDFHRVGIDHGFIYLVRPIGKHCRCDAVWTGLLQQSEFRAKYGSLEYVDKKYKSLEPSDIAQICQNYWSGVPSEDPAWEMLCESIEIVDQLSAATVLAKATKGGWKPNPSP